MTWMYVPLLSYSLFPLLTMPWTGSQGNPSFDSEVLWLLPVYTQFTKKVALLSWNQKSA